MAKMKLTRNQEIKRELQKQAEKSRELRKIAPEIGELFEKISGQVGKRRAKAPIRKRAQFSKMLEINVDEIERILKKNNWSVYKIAKEYKDARTKKDPSDVLSTTVIFGLLDGSNPRPTLETIDKIAFALSVNPLRLIVETNRG